MLVECFCGCRNIHEKMFAQSEERGWKWVRIRKFHNNNVSSIKSKAKTSQSCWRDKKKFSVFFFFFGSFFVVNYSPRKPRKTNSTYAHTQISPLRVSKFAKRSNCLKYIESRVRRKENDLSKRSTPKKKTTTLILLTLSLFLSPLSAGLCVMILLRCINVQHRKYFCCQS